MNILCKFCIHTLCLVWRYLKAIKLPFLLNRVFQKSMIVIEIFGCESLSKLIPGSLFQVCHISVIMCSFWSVQIMRAKKHDIVSQWICRTWGHPVQCMLFFCSVTVNDAVLLTYILLAAYSSSVIVLACSPLANH